VCGSSAAAPRCTAAHLWVPPAPRSCGRGRVHRRHARHHQQLHQLLPLRRHLSSTTKPTTHTAWRGCRLGSRASVLQRRRTQRPAPSGCRAAMRCARLSNPSCPVLSSEPVHIGAPVHPSLHFIGATCPRSLLVFLSLPEICSPFLSGATCASHPALACPGQRPPLRPYPSSPAGVCPPPLLPAPADLSVASHLFHLRPPSAHPAWQRQM
jgi:hypothetical protein